jgi:hypothetical protein
VRHISEKSDGVKQNMLTKKEMKKGGDNENEFEKESYTRFGGIGHGVALFCIRTGQAGR